MKPTLWFARQAQKTSVWRVSRRWRWALPTLLVGAIAAAVWLIEGDSKWPSVSPTTARQEAMGWKLVLDPNEPTTIVVQDSPEQMVRQIYRHLGEGERAQALALAENLASRYPNFQLGQLLYADLLNISLREPIQEPEVNQEVKPAAQRRLQELVLESTRRLLHPPVAGLKDKVPAGLLYLDPVHHPYVAAVDTSHSRLYWFVNRTDASGWPRLELLMDTYISVGSQGVGKLQEGDGRTPLGVYFIQKNLPGGTLPDLFGAGALTLNYPNAVDVMHKRTGSGIWLHGTPSAQYSRAPEATDGCVVLSNPEMTRLLGLGNLRLTPVLIARELQWQPTGEPTSEQTDLMARLEAWNQARLKDDDTALRSHYSEHFERDGLGLDPWWPKLRNPSLNRQNNRPLDMLSAVRWKDNEEMMVVTWLDPNRSAPQRNEYLRTYWARESGEWKIVFEGPV